MQGGKLSVLAAAVDPRVVALCLLDPVDNTVWAPLGPGYPSGIQALKKLGDKQVPTTQFRICLATCETMMNQQSAYMEDLAACCPDNAWLTKSS